LLSYNLEITERKLGRRKLGSENEKLLLECAEKEIANKQVKSIYITDLATKPTNFT
jgi:hypothetical protein